MDNSSKKIQYWTVSAGEGGRLWNEFYNKEIFGVGWDEIGDFNSYNTKEEIQIALKKKREYETSARNDALACFEFTNTIKTGDILIVKKGNRELLGYVEVISDYTYDDTRPEYKHIRKVNWITKGNWEIPEKIDVH